MTRIVKAERFSLAAAWEVAKSFADGDRTDSTKEKWTSLLKRYPTVSMKLYTLAMHKDLRESADILSYVPFGISPRIVDSMIKANMTGVEKPAHSVKISGEEDEQVETNPVVKISKTTTEKKNPEQTDIEEMLRQMEEV